MHRTRLLLAGVALLPLGCGGTEPGPAAAITLSAVGGSGQSALSLDTLPEMVIVYATDEQGNGVQGVVVNWSIVDAGEGATIIPASNLTDASGHARARWVLGIGSGTQNLSARASGSDSPVRVAAEALPGLKAVTLMKQNYATHACAADADGATWCWGENRAGQLGNGSHGNLESVALETPQRVVGAIGFRSLSGMESLSCGLTAAGELWCWGRTHGWLRGGLGAPTRFAADLRFRSVTMADNVVCGIALDGQGYCWGRGVIGDGVADAGHYAFVPKSLPADLRWREIVPGDHNNTHGITEELDVYAWGSEGGGLTRPSNQEFYGIDASGYLAVPTLTPVVSGLTGLAPGGISRCGLRNGAAICWGLGPLGDPLAPPSPGPGTTRVGGDDFVQLTAGYLAFYGLTSTGRVYSWGQLPPGSAPSESQMTPVALAGAGPWSAIGTGRRSKPCAILAADSTVYCWHFEPDNALPTPVPPPATP